MRCSPPMDKKATQATTPIKPADRLIIADLETLKVLADPLRLSIIQYLRKPGTVKQVSAKVSKPPTKLYYHFNLLEKHGLIQMVDTRLVSGVMEKQYQVAARVFKLAPGLLSPGSEEFEERFEVILSGMFADARNDLHESMLAGVVETADDSPRHRQLFIYQGRLRLTPERAIELYERLGELYREFDDGDDETREPQPGEISYKTLVLLHPSVRDDLATDSLADADTQTDNGSQDDS